MRFLVQSRYQATDETDIINRSKIEKESLSRNWQTERRRRLEK